MRLCAGMVSLACWMGSGAEFVPCTYDGLVWDGGTAWVKQNDGWHEYTIPGVAKPDPLDTLSGDIVAPDTRPTRTDTVYFRRTPIAATV